MIELHFIFTSGSYVMSRDIQFFEEKEEDASMLKNIVWISELTFFIDTSGCENELTAVIPCIYCVKK